MMFFQNHLHKAKQNLILFLSDVSSFVVLLLLFFIHPDLLWMFLFICVRHNMQNLGIKAPRFMLSSKSPLIFSVDSTNHGREAALEEFGGCLWCLL